MDTLKEKIAMTLRQRVGTHFTDHYLDGVASEVAASITAHDTEGLIERLETRAYATFNVRDTTLLTDARDALRALSAALVAAEAERNDARLEIVSAFYRAWPHAEDMDDTDTGIIGLVEQLASERDAAQAENARLLAALNEIAVPGNGSHWGRVARAHLTARQDQGGEHG